MPKWQKRDNVFVSAIIQKKKEEIYAHSNVVFNSSSYSHMDGSNDWLAGKSRAKHIHTHRHTNTSEAREWKRNKKSEASKMKIAGEKKERKKENRILHNQNTS